MGLCSSKLFKKRPKKENKKKKKKKKKSRIDAEPPAPGRACSSRSSSGHEGAAPPGAFSPPGPAAPPGAFSPPGPAAPPGVEATEEPACEDQAVRKTDPDPETYLRLESSRVSLDSRAAFRRLKKSCEALSIPPPELVFSRESCLVATASIPLIEMENLGFCNLGNSCFMNAILQSLLSLSSVCSDLVTQESAEPEEKSEDSHTSFSLLRSLAQLHLSRNNSNKIKKGILKEMEQWAFSCLPDFSEGMDQDAHEFLMMCLSQMKSEGEALMFSRESYRCPVANFEFMVDSIRTCKSCGHRSTRTEDYNHLSLDLTPEGTLQNSLDLFFKAADLEYRCGCCPGEQASVTLQLSALPRVLVLILKRFKFINGRMTKLSNHMAIPTELTLSCGETAQQQCSQSQDGGAIYELTSVVSHLGRMFGHYISDIIEGSADGWLCLNDSYASRLSEQEILQKRAKKSYLLFYVQRAPQDPPC
ncbi:ubiquitin carboxyl-terminal hydrolase 37-like [Denticeps clupeoides]|uniref:ubiquitin carboxyl-terminal hydrolase 37-like n=1 Tax=Denticeps clupeoides TaxID=299321 RepID=UPI0010A43E65|nr:ubiquitin carboxyl-terminal hydrolase 37-like [Denticeps clupeoides]